MRTPAMCLALSMTCALAACAMDDASRRTTMSADTRLQVAEAVEASGDSDLAISMYSTAAAADPGNIELQLRCADALARKGRISEARQLLDDRLRANPGQPDLTRALALTDLVAGRLADAIAGLDRNLAANPGDTRALVDKAVALDLQGQHAAAQSLYQQVTGPFAQRRCRQEQYGLVTDAGGASAPGTGDTRADAEHGYLASEAEDQPRNPLCRQRR